MKNRKLEKIIQNAKRYSPNTEEKAKYLNQYIKLLSNYVKKFMDENPEIDKKDISEKIIEEFSDVLTNYCDIAYMRSEYYRYEAMKQLLKDKDKLKEISERIIKKENLRTNVTYGDNIENNLINVVEEVLAAIREIKEERQIKRKKYENIKKQNIEKKKSKNQKSKNKKTYSKSEKQIEAINFLLTEDSFNSIQFYIEEIILPDFEKEIREKQINLFKLMYEELSKFGLLEKYLITYNNEMKSISLPELGYELETRDFKDEIGLKEVFSEKFLQNCDLEKVITLSTFWQNRFAKETESINKAIFAIDTLGLWDDLINGKDISISEDTARGIYSKINCMNKIASNLFIGLKDKYKNLTDSEKNYIKVDPNREIDIMVAQEGENYRQIFEEMLPMSNNNLLEDIHLYKIIYNLTENLYEVRNTMLMTQIECLSMSPHTKNWGILREEYNGYGEYRNTDEDSYALIYIDYEGFNMPLKLHVKRSKLIEVLKINKKEAIIPEYLGDKDFVINGSLLKNQIFMPMLKSHKKVINSEYGRYPGTSRDNFLGHLRYLKDKNNGRFPHHLMRKIETKKGTKLQRPKKKYFNLETREEYYLEDGKYVSIGTKGEKDVKGKGDF